ncbi:hypothetical protein HDA32_000812 [Spinactinospora alkalitolerans]|uniref:DUF3054 domain-containing protein n=1 Tax=Spinactinospora alkalitolerans TaxID=687207 RepID=A0A852TS57_9ACTN|nr:DUF3054 domain-containing protein [Spinactinospora alkalitolerans]NYE45692.1 hypothetical protein [Spinactinospora alkalitolerans]
MRLLPAALLDVVCVLAFVLIGRSSHEEGNALLGIVDTAWPFALGLAVGWLATRAWRAPARLVGTGLGVWVVTVAGGLLLRVATGDGAPVSFAVVTSLFLGATLLGWRAAALLIERRARRAPTAGPR